MKLTKEQRETLANAAEILHNIFLGFGKTNTDFCDTAYGVYMWDDVEDAETICEVFSKTEEVKYTNDFDPEDCK
jgi:hypothetical protein